MGLGASTRHKVVGESRFLLTPRSWADVAWSNCVAALVIASLIELPLSLAFPGYRAQLFPYHVLIDTVYACDVLKRANTALLDTTEVHSRRRPASPAPAAASRV